MNVFSRGKLLVGLLAVSACWCLLTQIGCQNQSEDSQGKIRIQLNWFPDAQHGGFYAALLNGHYQDEGLDVEILPGGPGANVESKVDLGRVEFGIANAHRILLKRNEGAKITAVFASFQKSPRCIMVHKESGISSFQDLEGVTLAVGSDTAFYRYLQQKVELKNVKLVTYSGSNAKFLSDKSYAQQAYSISEPILVKRKGANPVSLMLSDIGFNPYTSCLFASEEMISDQPELVRKFVRATQKGWLDYLENPEKANMEMEKLNKEHDLQALNEGAAAARELCRPEDQTVVGLMTGDRWETLVEQLQSIKMLKPSFEMGSAFSTDFIPHE
jgi:NitT/TauT family transport system substrate-binding protein